MHSDKNNSSVSVLKVFASSSDKINGKLLYEVIVRQAQAAGITGVTVYRGIMGFGLSSKISSSKFWELTEKLPIVIEMIDATEKLSDFYQRLEPELTQMSKGCLVTLTPAQILLQQKGIRPE
ncbi:MAG: DUF190 domain-containing protein [Deltaproteobacteria bacterium]|nr:DUF190 domain-containing protein [Deltaproteobacteria bacterium]